MPHEDVPTTDCGSWFELPDGAFEIRSPTYFDDKVKQPSKSAVFANCHWVLIDTDSVLFNVCARLAPLQAFLRAHPDDEFLVTNRACPCNGIIRNIICVSKRVVPVGQDPAFDRAWTRYKDGSAKDKDLRMKYLPRLTTAPWMLKTSIDTLGGQRPVIMGKGYLEQQHTVGPNYTELVVDISSSAVANKIAGLALGGMTGLVIDEAFVVEAKDEDELPERVLAQVQFRNVDTHLAARPLRAEDYGEQPADLPPAPAKKPAGASSGGGVFKPAVVAALALGVGGALYLRSQ